MSRGISISRVGGACCALLALAGVAAFATTPSPVSPGEHGRFARVEARCPSFSWTFLPAASSVEIAVFAQPQVSDASTFDPEAAELVLFQRLPGATSSWTPSLDRCLEPGRRYAWYVRALHALQEAEPTGADEAAGDHSTSAVSAADGAATSPTPAPWSEARLFEVRERAAEDELADAIEVVRRYLRERGELPADAALVESIDGADRRRELRRDPESADRPQVARREETAIPERERSAAGSEPTIVLGGDPVARLAASDFVRESDDPEAFHFHNPGDGTMTLRVDGVDVVTTATDQDTTYLPGNQLQLTGTTFDVLEGTGSGLDADLFDGLDSSQFLTTVGDPWVDEVGDTMTGLLTIDPAAGFALTTGSGDSINLGGDLFRGGTLFLHATGIANTGAGLGALAAVTGSANTAVGSSALDANTSGSSNTALGADALGANVSGGSNTAIGRNALLANTASANTAVGADALDANTSGMFNTALGVNALGANQSGGTNTAIGHDALLANTTASGNTAVGASALDANTSGSANTALGVHALGGNQTGLANTAIGRYALFANTASSNTAVGADALDANTTGGDNTAVGRNALGANVDGASNTAVGASALDANTSGIANTALGVNALGANETGFSNTAVGRDALLANTAGGNTAVGASALDANTSGSGNTALGHNALGSNLTGVANTAVGSYALRDSTAIGNTAVGASALDANTSGSGNTALGVNALGSNLTGGANTALGSDALLANTASSNTAVGADALASNTSGIANTALGSGALGANQTGSGNIAIGFGAGENLTTGSNNIAIGNAGVAGEGGRLRIGIQGTQTDTFIAGIHGNTTGAAGIAVLVDANGELGTISSSRRFKEDIAAVGASSSRLHELRPVSFHYRRETTGSSEAGERPLEYGLIAEEVAEVYPELVIYDDSGAPYTVRYHLLVPLLLAELQRQGRENAEQRAEIEELRRSMTDGR